MQGTRSRDATQIMALIETKARELDAGSEAYGPRSNGDMVVALLVAGGFVSEDKAAQAREIVAGLSHPQAAEGGEGMVEAADIEVTVWPETKQGSMYVGISKGVKVVHVPTGTTVICNHERSQHRNRDAAIRALSAALSARKPHG